MTIAPDVVAALEKISAGAAVESQESEVLEFKQDAREDGETIRVILDAAICLANLRGGHIVLGAADRRGGTGALLGTDTDADHLRERIYALS